MDNIWFSSALWIGLALAASVMQRWIAVSIALLEIIIGAVAGNVIDLTLTPWVNYLAGFGAILLTFLAGAEIDVNVIRRNFGSTMSIGVVGFFAPYLGVLFFAHFVSGWPWPQAQIAGIALSTSIVYATAFVYLRVTLGGALNRCETANAELSEAAMPYSLGSMTEFPARNEV